MLLTRLESEATSASAAAAAAVTRRRELESRQEELKKNLKVRSLVGWEHGCEVWCEVWGLMGIIAGLAVAGGVGALC
jgi:hypothetical protein